MLRMVRMLSILFFHTNAHSHISKEGARIQFAIDKRRLLHYLYTHTSS